KRVDEESHPAAAAGARVPAAAALVVTARNVDQPGAAHRRRRDQHAAARAARIRITRGLLLLAPRADLAVENQVGRGERQHAAAAAARAAAVLHRAATATQERPVDAVVDVANRT